MIFFPLISYFCASKALGEMREDMFWAKHSTFTVVLNPCQRFLIRPLRSISITIANFERESLFETLISVFCPDPKLQNIIYVT